MDTGGGHHQPRSQKTDREELNPHSLQGYWLPPHISKCQGWCAGDVLTVLASPKLPVQGACSTCPSQLAHPKGNVVHSS